MVEFQLAMTYVLEGHRQELADLCRKYRVRRLDVFGSAGRGDFDEESSDVDLLVEFDDMPHADRADRTWVPDRCGGSPSTSDRPG